MAEIRGARCADAPIGRRIFGWLALPGRGANWRSNPKSRKRRWSGSSTAIPTSFTT